MTKTGSKIFVGIGVLALLTLYFVYNPSSSQLFPKCPFHSATGLHCPVCGSQRAIHDLAHLRILDALGHNLLVILTLTFGSILFLFWRNKFDRIIYHPKAPYIIFGIVGVYWILRNLNFVPFYYLAP